MSTTALVLLLLLLAFALLVAQRLEFHSVFRRRSRAAPDRVDP